MGTDKERDVWAALGDATRRAIVLLLAAGPMSVGDLAAQLPVTRPAVSQHLKVLKDAGLVVDRREGRWSYYTIVPDALAEVHDLTVGMTPKKGTLPILRTGSCCG